MTEECTVQWLRYNLTLCSTNITQISQITQTKLDDGSPTQGWTLKCQNGESYISGLPYSFTVNFQKVLPSPMSIIRKV